MPLLSRQDPRPRRLAQLETQTETDRLPASLALRPVVPVKPLSLLPLPKPRLLLPAELLLAHPELVDDEAAVELDPRGLVAPAPLLEAALAETGEVVGLFEGGDVGVGAAGAGGGVVAAVGVVVPGSGLDPVVFFVMFIVVTILLAIRLTLPGL